VLKFSFRNRVVDQWHILPEKVVDQATSINSFKNRIDKFLDLNLGES
jgi:hypothetical protein